MPFFEILQSVQRVVSHFEESSIIETPKFAEVPENVLFEHDSNRFKLPHYSRNYFLKTKTDKNVTKHVDLNHKNLENSNPEQSNPDKDTAIILKTRLPLRSLPTGMDVSEYSGFFAEALADSCCSDHAEQFGMGTDNIVKDSHNHGFDYVRQADLGLG